MALGELEMKKILIDGHNLIPKIPGIHLSDMDDENKLISLIGEYCRLERVYAELFFDNAQPGSAVSARHGLVSVHYVRQGATADDAILQYLKKQGNNARNLLVVSSDNRVKAEARALHAAVTSSEQFSSQVQAALSSPAAELEKKERPPTDEEVEEMLRLMTRKRE